MGPYVMFLFNLDTLEKASVRHVINSGQLAMKICSRTCIFSRETISRLNVEMVDQNVGYTTDQYVQFEKNAGSRPLFPDARTRRTIVSKK